MSVEKPNKIDFISFNEQTGRVCLSISDHLEWDLDNKHLVILQNKLNRYLDCIESKEIYTLYPEAINKDFEIKVFFKYQPNNKAKIFLDKVSEILNDKNIKYSF